MVNDLTRCGGLCDDDSIDPNTKDNILFNILNAYAHYDPQLGYC